MKKKILFLNICFFTIVAVPLTISANGGVWIWPPNIHVNQTDQNAIIAWNGQEEILILSTNWEKPASSQTTTLLKVVPLPAEPSEIKEGETEIFDKLVKILNEKINAMQAPTLGEDGKSEGINAGVEIVFQKTIGAHDITVVKVNKGEDFSKWVDDFATKKILEKKQVSEEFKNGLLNYLKRDINYFVFDIANLNEAKTTVKPLIYKFKSNYFYFPMLVSGISEISESQTKVNLFLIFDESLKLPSQVWHGNYNYWVNDNGFDIKLNNDELKSISENLSSLFGTNIIVRRFEMNGKLNEISKDLMLFPQILTSNLSMGIRNNDVKILQQLLINEGFWESEVGATGYFGPITRKAVMKLQNQYKTQILEPLGLSSPTGFFGPYTRKYLNENIFIGVK
ncbi:MAG: peptidoglycan-binding protein [Candidatus Berkelbacteria bacterium]|nr:peptidoglycan-binding protein [Candidatus Berkelbacteria bacterium]